MSNTLIKVAILLLAMTEFQFCKAYDCYIPTICQTKDGTVADWSKQIQFEKCSNDEVSHCKCSELISDFINQTNKTFADYEKKIVQQEQKYTELLNQTSDKLIECYNNLTKHKEEQDRNYIKLLNETSDNLIECYKNQSKLSEVLDLDCDDVCKCLRRSDCLLWRNNSVGFATSGTSLERKDYRTYCDCSNETDGAWLIIQRRVDGSVDFNRSWTEYVAGFGRTDGDFWMGLDAMSKLTETGTWRLRINLESFQGNKTTFDYHKFQIGNSSTNYTLMISGSVGLAGILSQGHNGKQFSTYDYNIAGFGSVTFTIDNCAKHHGGGWWYLNNAGGCFIANLNGKFNATKQCDSSLPHHRNGIIWSFWPGIGSCTPLKSSEMKIQLKP